MYRLLIGLMLISIHLSVSAEKVSLSTIKLQGTIPQHVSFDVDDLDANGSKSLFGGGGEGISLDSATFAAGYVEIPDAIKLTGINANVPVYLQVRNKGWTVPKHYNSIRGGKNKDGSDEQLRMKVTHFSKEAGTLEPQGTFGSKFTALSNKPANLVKIGEIDSQGRHTGVRNGEVEVDMRIYIDSTYDVPGGYGVDLEVTIAPQT
jgi:hypothetical protein